MAETMDHPDRRVPSPINSKVSRHRPSLSDGSRFSPSSKPVDEAVTSALDQAQTESANKIPPELIAQITEKVIKQLQVSGIDAPTNQPVSPPPQTAIHNPPPPPQSPSTTASGTSPNMPERVLTPPSPEKHVEPSTHTSPPLHPDHAREGRRSPTKDAGSGPIPPRRAPSPYSQSSETSESAYTRPRGPPRLSSAKEETTLEKIWGQLFDEEGNSTARLGQLLRGLAVHLIEDYHPKHSLVITPDKMARYYEDVRLSQEAYPWSMVFDDEQTSISRMYRDLKCQHHLVQEKHDQRPDIPGLTPVGFERWVTLLIHAHPEAEFERLQKAILDMPISNPDDKKERFPKEISRRLFPVHEDTRTREMIEDSISEHAAIDLPRQPSHESLHSHSEATNAQAQQPPENPPVPASHRASVSFADQATNQTNPATTPQPPNLERERKPYSNVPTESVIDDTNPPTNGTSSHTQPNPLERERKPYSAQPGGGKLYEEDPYRPTPVNSNSSSTQRETSRQRADSVVNASANPRPLRADSSVRSRPISIAQSRPMDIPRPEIHHHRAPSNAGSNVSAGGPPRRRRSPSFSRGATSDFRRSEPDVRSYGSSYDPYTSSAPRGGNDAVLDESDTRRYFDRQARERAERLRREEEGVKHFGESPRKSYEPQYSSSSSHRRGTEYVPPDEDYHRTNGGGGRGYDYQQPYGGPLYR